MLIIGTLQGKQRVIFANCSILIYLLHFSVVIRLGQKVYTGIHSLPQQTSIKFSWKEIKGLDRPGKTWKNRPF